MKTESTDKTILVVDDDKDIREAIAEILEADGFKVRTAVNGEAALVDLQTRPLPRLIFLDLMMPIKDGFAFVQEQRLDSELSKIPVVVMSADSHVDENIRRLRTAEYLRKPLDIDAIAHVVQKYLI